MPTSSRPGSSAVPSSLGGRAARGDRLLTASPEIARLTAARVDRTVSPGMAGWHLLDGRGRSVEVGAILRQLAAVGADTAAPPWRWPTCSRRRSAEPPRSRRHRVVHRATDQGWPPTGFDRREAPCACDGLGKPAGVHPRRRSASSAISGGYAPRTVARLLCPGLRCPAGRGRDVPGEARPGDCSHGTSRRLQAPTGRFIAWSGSLQICAVTGGTGSRTCVRSVIARAPRRWASTPPTTGASRSSRSSTPGATSIRATRTSGARAEDVKRGIWSGGRIPGRAAGDVAVRAVPEAHHDALPQPARDGDRGAAALVPDRRRGAHGRLRQDDAGAPHGRRVDEPAGDLPAGRAHAAGQLGRHDAGQRLATPGSTGPTCGRRDHRGGLGGDRERHRPLARPLHDHGHGLDDDQRGRGARRDAARGASIPAADSRHAAMAAHRAGGSSTWSGRTSSSRRPDEDGVRQRGHDGAGARRIDQRDHPPHRDGQPPASPSSLERLRRAGAAHAVLANIRPSGST